MPADTFHFPLSPRCEWVIHRGSRAFQCVNPAHGYLHEFPRGRPRRLCRACYVLVYALEMREAT